MLKTNGSKYNNAFLSKIKKFYLIILIIIGLFSLAIYSTYAMFATSVETNMVNMDTYMNYTFDINGTQELKVSAGSKLRFNAIVKNSMEDTISYGMYYKMINPSTLPSGVIIAQVSDNLSITAKGTLISNDTVTVPLVIKNTSDTDIIVEIGVKTGYATESQGVDDIIYNSGEIPISDFQTNEEAGNDSCTSTMECTSECVSKQINGNWVEMCNCYTGNNSNTISGSEFGNYLKSISNGVKNSVTGVTTENEGIWETEDNYGTTYYYRGNITNNYVYFAGYYWRIIRVNGDGSIRIIYDGKTAHANGEVSEDRQIDVGKVAYNSTYNDNAYVGYMYGSAGANNYDATHTNTNNSTIKTVVDNWYKTNIQDKGYHDKVADAIYCNDRKPTAGVTDYGILGYGSNSTLYGPGARINENGFWDPPTVNEIKLVCRQKNDAFTVSDTVKGNGALTYPIGLLTIDEFIAAGGFGEGGSNNIYLRTGNYYWTMSPCYFSGSPRIYVIYPSGMISNIATQSTWYVKPVISLKSSVILSGTGTMTDPYVVQ